MSSRPVNPLNPRRRPKKALSQIELVRSDLGRAFLYLIAYHTLDREKESDAALRELITKHHTICGVRNRRGLCF